MANSETGIYIRQKMQLWHWAIIISYVAFTYYLYAQKWSSSLINAVFFVDPSKFSITDSFLTVLIAPVSLLYYPSYLEGIHLATMLIGMLIIPVLGILVIAGFPLKKTSKIIGSIFAITILLSLFVTLMINFNKHLEKITRSFALNTDFNSSIPCNNKWRKDATSAIFLGGGQVLVYFENRASDKQLEILSCKLDWAYNKQFNRDK
jgi:hypothetical protein